MRFNPGLNIHHPVANEGYLIRNRMALSAEPEPFKPVSRKWRNWWTKNDQGPTPRCTAFGTLTALACTPITHPKHNPLVNPQTFYEEIQAIDRSEGRFYSEGATTDAAMKAARARGWISAWYWGYTMDTLLRTVDKQVVVTGTIWLNSMFERDAEGIIKVDYSSGSAGGHLWCINGIDAKRGLLRIPQTWGDGNYFISLDDYYKLLRDDGEFAIFDEVPAL